MKNKLCDKRILLKIMAVYFFVICGVGVASSNSIESNSSNQSSNYTQWNEIPINDHKYKILPTYYDFNLLSLIHDADYIFSGTVVNRKEYEVSWINDCGESMGPYPSSVIEVEINENYYGEPNAESKTIKVYSPDSLSADIQGSLQLKENYEYIFITKYLDDMFISQKNIDDKFEQEKHADVYISNLRDNIILKYDNDIVAYKGFFSDSNILKKDRIKELHQIDGSVNNEIIESNTFVMLDKRDFEKVLQDTICKIG